MDRPLTAEERSLAAKLLGVLADDRWDERELRWLLTAFSLFLVQKRGAKNVPPIVRNHVAQFVASLPRGEDLAKQIEKHLSSHPIRPELRAALGRAVREA
jgi:hypothetical protein